MESEKKKKKNKKKKNKQAKSMGDTASVSITTHLEQNHVSALEHNAHIQSSNDGEVDNSGHSESDANLDHYQVDEQMHVHTHPMPEGALACLESEKKCWLNKEACLEEKIRQLEVEKKSWIVQESSNKAMIARLNEANVVLQAEVKELNQSKDQLLQGRQELVSRINDLELHIQQLNTRLTFHSESQIIPKDDDHSVHRGGANSLVEKLMTQNAELMGKVNELHVQIDQLKSASMAATIAEIPTTPVGISTAVTGAANDLRSPPHIEAVTSFDAGASKSPTVRAAAPTHADTTVQAPPFPAEPQPSEKPDAPLPINGHLPNSMEGERVNNSNPSENISFRIRLDEVSATYDNIEIVEETESESRLSEDEKPSTESVVEEREVPLSDAPLIGAPFRLLGFMARYVSGADLVKPKKVSG